MGCIGSSSVTDSSILNDVRMTEKSSKSIKSKSSMNSNFSRKRTKRAKKTNKLTLTPEQLSIEDQNDEITIRKPTIKKTNTKVRQMAKRLSLEDIVELNNILIQHFFFFKLKKQQRVRLIEELKLYEVKKTKNVYEIGDKADRLYIVKEGLLQIQTQRDNNERKLIYKGECFGENDLIFNLQRTQSIVAKQTSKVWGLDRQFMEQIKEQLIRENRQLTKTYLRKVPTFSYLSAEEVQLISLKMFMFKYRGGRIIFSKGDEADKLFIISSGQVQLQIPNKNNLIVKAGQVFGEGCLKLNPLPRIGSARSYTQSRCLVIFKTDFSKSLGGNHIQNINHFSILKWAFKRSTEFMDESSSVHFKMIQKGTISYFKDRQNIFQNRDIHSNYYFVSLSDQVNEYGVGNLINCSLNNEVTEYIKYGDGPVFILEIKKAKLLGKSLKMVKFQQNKQCDLRVTLGHSYKQDDFKYSNWQSFLHNLILIKKLKTAKQNEGESYNVLNKAEGKFYLIKCIKKQDIVVNKKIQRLTELKKILTQAKSCQFLSPLYRTFIDTQHVYFVYKDNPNGSLQQLIQNHKLLNPQVIIHIAASVLIGLQYIHLKMSAIHRNISLESIFLDEFGYFCIDYFQNVKVLQKQSSYRTFTIIGTPHYLAPQIINGKGYSFEIDYWALGIIMYRIVYGKFPFSNQTKDPFDIFKYIIKNSIDFKPSSKANPKIINFIRQMLSSDPVQRTCKDQSSLKSHELFQNFDWQRFQRKSISLAFDLEVLKVKKVDLKYYEDGKNMFGNFLSKQKKKMQAYNSNKIANFQSWDFHFK